MTGLQPIVLKIYKGDQLAGVRQFLEEQIVFGRQAEAQVSLQDDQISIIHAAIEKRDDGYYICDLGSSIGTFRNGESVLDVKLESGDLIQIGPYRIEFFVGVPRTKTVIPEMDMTKTQPAVAPLSPPIAVSAPAAPSPAPVQSAPPPPPPAPSQTPPPLVPREPVSPLPVPPKLSHPDLVPPPPLKPQFNINIPKAPPPVSSPPPPVLQPQAPTPSPSFSATPVANPFPPVVARKPAPAPGPSIDGVEKKNSFAKHQTFAPPSAFRDVRDYVKPGKGSVVEIAVAWQERVIMTKHFSEAKVVTIGTHPDCDFMMPNFSVQKLRLPIVKIDTRATVLIPARARGELIRGSDSIPLNDPALSRRLSSLGESSALQLEQGELIRVELTDGVSILVRYGTHAPKPLVAPFLDFTTSGATGVIMAVAMVAVLALYTSLYAPQPSLVEDKPVDIPRAAIIIAEKPKPPPPPPPPKVEPPPPKPEPPPPPPPPKRVKPTEKPVPNPSPKPAPKVQAEAPHPSKNPGAAAANAAPNKNKNGPRTLTSPKQGGSIKTTDSKASQMKTKDVTKAGMFSVLGTKGAQDDLAQGSAGAGELAGLANQSTGRSGMNENRAGQGLGSAIKDTGRGGTGTAMMGVAGGVGTAGRGSGNTGYGEGGYGGRQGVKIVPGGSGEGFSGSIDREAIRRAIYANYSAIKACYEKQLNRKADLFGKIILKWDIGEQGRVVSAVRTDSNELGSAEVANCVAGIIKTIQFPEPPGNQVVEVKYPFVFSN